jgi:hypothetical protein
MMLLRCPRDDLHAEMTLEDHCRLSKGDTCPADYVYFSLVQPVFASPQKKIPSPARRIPSPIGEPQLKAIN